MCYLNILIFILLAWLAYAYGRVWNNWNNLVLSLGAEKSGLTSAKLMLEGKEFYINYIFNSEYQSSQLQVYTKVDFQGHLIIRRRNQLDNVGKIIGLKEDFNEGYFCECDDSLFLEKFLKAPEAKKAVLNLLVFTEKIEITKSKITITKTPIELVEINKSDLIDLFKSLIILVQFFPASTYTQSLTPETDRFIKTKKIFESLTLILACVGIIVAFIALDFYQPISRWEVFWSSLWLGVIGTIIFAFIYIKNFSGHAYSFKLVIVNILLASVGFIALSLSLITGLNSLLDSSESRVQTVKIINKRIADDGINYYFMRVTSEEHDLKDYEFQVSEKVYDTLHIDQKCLITTRQGFFRIQWVASYSCKEDTSQLIVDNPPDSH